MNWSNYGSLKTGTKVSFVKEKETNGDIEREFVVLISKSWDPATGEANSDSKREYSLSDLEREKARYDAQMEQAKAKSDGLALAITDFKAL
tara:strand:- start:689 stop:961 length:273 start_codon:yes stop_codon:yes gene_type:complete